MTPMRVDFWWKPYLPKGRPVAIEGDPGAGKSTLVLKIVAHLTTGQAFPNLEDYTPRPGTLPRAISVCSRPKMIRATPFCPCGGQRWRCVARVFHSGWSKPDGERGMVTMQDLDLLRQALRHLSPGAAGV